MNDPKTDCIVLQSGDRFAVIDGGPDETATTYIDYSDKVMAYLHSIGLNEDNTEFYLGTHHHIDHIGVADEVVREYKPDRVYIPEFSQDFSKGKENNKKFSATSQRLYSDLMKATEEAGSILIQNLNPNAPTIPENPTSTPTTHNYLLDAQPDVSYSNVKDHNQIFGYQDPRTTANPHFQFGNADIELVNYSDYYKFDISTDINDYCWGAKVSVNGHTIFLAGDINNFYGSEDSLKTYLGHIDLLKMGHHGYKGSNTYDYIKSISPTYAFTTGPQNTYLELQEETRRALEEIGTKFYCAPMGVVKGKDATIVTITDSGISWSVEGNDTSIVVWRLLNPWTGEHLFTKDTNERNYLLSSGWQDEDIAWRCPAKSDIEVFRVYNPWTGEHLYTSSDDEATYLENIGWNREGLAFYGDSENRKCVFRLYNSNMKNAASHHYTTDANESKVLQSLGWKLDGCLFYSIS